MTIWRSDQQFDGNLAGPLACHTVSASSPTPGQSRERSPSAYDE
jgi:hypothetical protein